MKKCITLIILTFFIYVANAQSDQELNRDSVIGWQYVSNPPNPKAVYKPVKSQYGNGAAYSVWQQQASDMLISWIQQSYLPRGLVMRTIAKNDQRWSLYGNGPLHSYGVDFLGYSTHFVSGKIDLKCCEQGQRLVAGFNDFPGSYINGFNPGGLYFFAENAQFITGDNDAQLSAEGIDKRIQPNLYNYRTYLDHYHDNGKQFFKIGVVIPKNGEWPFKPVLVKDAVAYIQQQLAAYPSILQKNPYDAEPIKAALEKLKPYYNEVAKLKGNANFGNQLKDDNGHSVLDPSAIINGNPPGKSFPEYYILVTTTQQMIDQTKTDNPLWVYFNLSPASIALEGNPAKFDAKFGTEIPHMVNAMLNNFNFEYVARWLAQPDARKGMVYTTVKAPAKSSGNTIAAATTISAIATEKNKDPYTILYEDFDGYAAGILSAKNWHTYALNKSANASLSEISGQKGKWASIPDKFTFYPDYNKQLPASFTVNYDVYFAPGISNRRSLFYFRMDAYDPKTKYQLPMDFRISNDEGVEFALAMSGETMISKEFRLESQAEVITEPRLAAFKENDIAHVSISVNGAAISVLVNGKEILQDNKVLPAGKLFKRYGWYCGVPAMMLGNVYVKSGNPVQNNPIREPTFAGLVKDKTPAAATFETSDYTFIPLTKLDNLPPINYPVGFKSAIPAVAENNNKPVGALPAFKTPERSALLNSLPNPVLTGDAFKKNINDLAAMVSARLQKSNTDKIDNYLKIKKINAASAISSYAIGVWTEGKPTVAFYLFCKALQADYTDLNTANNLASLLNAYGYSEKAIPVLQYVNSKLKGSPGVLANMATAYYNLGDMGNAFNFAGQSIAKDSLNANGNKVAAFVHLSKAAADKTEATKAIQCLKQSLKSQYDKEAADMLSKIESNHEKQHDFANTNFKTFTMLKKLELPAMPESLQQMLSFDQQLEREKSSINKTSDELAAAIKKIPGPDNKQIAAAAMQNAATAMMMFKAAAIVNESSQWYMKAKKDLEDIFTAGKKELTKKYNEKVNAITKKYNDRLNKLEGGENKADEEEEMERLKTQRCEDYNKESGAYLSDIAKLTNQFAQRSEYVSRTYCRDLANWKPIWILDKTNRTFLEAQRTYVIDANKILSFYTAIEPCIYPALQTRQDNAASKPKAWEDKYCPAVLNQNFKLGLAGFQSNCTSFTIEGGEGLLGEVNVNYDEGGTFKDITIGVGVGADIGIGVTGASASAGVSGKEYITISSSPNGGPQVSDWGVKAGVSAGVNAGPLGSEVNIASTNISVSTGVSADGVVANALGLK